MKFLPSLNLIGHVQLGFVQLCDGQRNTKLFSRLGLLKNNENITTKLIKILKRMEKNLEKNWKIISTVSGNQPQKLPRFNPEQISASVNLRKTVSNTHPSQYWPQTGSFDCR